MLPSKGWHSPLLFFGVVVVVVVVVRVVLVMLMLVLSLEVLKAITMGVCNNKGAIAGVGWGQWYWC